MLHCAQVHSYDPGSSLMFLCALCRVTSFVPIFDTRRAGLVHGEGDGTPAHATARKKKRPLTARLRWSRARRAFSVANLLTDAGRRAKHGAVAALLGGEALFQWDWDVWDLAALTPRPVTTHTHAQISPCMHACTPCL